jgi:hypothetical protein
MTKNGRDHADDNVTSLDEARRRAAAKAKAEKQAARGARAPSLRDWVIGGLVIAMALGYFASFFVEAPGLGGAGQ